MPSNSSSNEVPALYTSAPFRNHPFQTLRDGALAWILLLAAFATYFFTLQPGAFPGTPASLAAAATGAQPNLSPSHFIWNCLMALVAGSGSGMVYRMNLASAVFGALAVFLCYKVVLRLLTLAIEPTQVGRLPASRFEEGVRLAARASRIGATASALALAFCIPFWIAATRVYHHTFYVCWLLLCAQLLLTFSRTRNLTWAVLWAFVHGVGMTQTSAFIDFFPLLLAYFVYVLWADERIRPVKTLVATLVALLLGLSVLLLAANAFIHSPNAEFTSYSSVFNCVRRMARGLIRGTRGGLSQAPWLILIGLSIAPWLAALITARRALNGENSWSFYGLHAVIAAIVVLVVLDFKASPWRFMGTNNTTIVPYLLSAMTYGYIAAYLCLLPHYLWDTAERVRLQHFGRNLATVFALVFLALPICAAASNLRETSNRGVRQFTLYADHMLDSLGGRPWLISDGFFDDIILLRAKERGVAVRCINPTTLSLRVARKQFTDPTLRNAANLGLQSLIQEWLTHTDTVTKELAISRFPDFWELGGFKMLPNRLVFLGATEEEFRAIDFDASIAEHEKVWTELKAAFDEIAPQPMSQEETKKIPGDAPSVVTRVYRDVVLRPQMSFVGNNLGFSISMLSRDESLPADRRKALSDAAYAVYTKIHEIDPINISATLNWASKVFDREPAEKQTEARENLNDLNKKLDANLSTTMRVWSLSRYYGYVEDPAFFAILGWTWANTGQPNLAMQALAAAENTMPEHSKLRMKSDIARLHLAAARPDESEKLYFEMLVEDPGNREALMGLVHIFAFRGDTRKAREFLGRAEQAGEPIATRQIASAIIYSVEGDDISARSILQTLVDTDPQNINAWSMLCSILFEQKDAMALADAIKTLETRAGMDSYQTLIAKAMLAEMGGVEAKSASDTDSDVNLRNRLTEARDYYVRALRSRPGNVMLLNRILTLDFQIADKPHARQHAEEILRQDLHAPFANYILGSLAIDAADYKGAEAYLRRAVDKEPTIANLNDLADVLVKLEQLDEADLRIQQAFQLENADSSYELWDTQGLAQAARDRNEEALASYQKALALFGDDLRVHLHLATLYQKQGKTDLAAELIRTIARQADTLPRTDRKQFEELHLKVLGVRFSKSDYK